jgi:glyoxylase-like metal-dependent hydrolase (beta-lactamase superfamily II)
MVGTDGMKLSVGDASIQIVTMPGHTPGTFSYLFEVRELSVSNAGSSST